MFGIDVKRGVESTLERVYSNTKRRFERVRFSWSGRTASVSMEGNSARINFPGIDESKEVDRSMFNELIGYALHELGHVWFTNNSAWDKARREHGAFVGSLINGLEDPRIEKCVIDSEYAPNSRALFENLTNAVLIKDGYVDPDDFKNIPFVLAIEGRRLNGYNVCVQSVVDQAPWAEHLRWALGKAHKARTTAAIIEIAIELSNRLKQDQQPEQPEQPQEPQDSSEPPNSDGDGQGQDGDDQGNGGDSDGSDGDSGDAGDSGESGDAGDSGKTSGEKPTDKSGYGHSVEGGRDVEPSGFINDRLQEVKADADEVVSRPHAGKPRFKTIIFE